MAPVWAEGGLITAHAPRMKRLAASVDGELFGVGLSRSSRLETAMWMIDQISRHSFAFASQDESCALHECDCFGQFEASRVNPWVLFCFL